MARLSKAEQEAYAEELEYSAGGEPFQRGYARGVEQRGRPVNRAAEVTTPPPTTYQRIKGAVTTAAQVARDIGQNPHVQQIRRQDGFAGPVSAAPRHATSRQEYNGAPVHETSVMHPGNRIVVMRCSDETGQCKTIATGISTTPVRQPRQPRQRPWQRGGLGGNDPGF